MQIAEIFRGKVVDVTKRAVIIEVTGTTDKIEAFETMVRPFGLIEMMRTGEIAISRGRSRDLAIGVGRSDGVRRIRAAAHQAPRAASHVSRSR